MTLSLMRRETFETSSRVKLQQEDSENFATVANEIKSWSPEFIMIVARGSSDHAGVFAKYLFEVELGIPTMSAALSVSSIYQKTLKLSRALVIVISQSGQSPDLLAQVASAHAGGAKILALVNDQTSPIVRQADWSIPLNAGAERSVAATKSYLCTLSALLRLVANWNNDAQLMNALNELPHELGIESKNSAQIRHQAFKEMGNCVVIGRGFGYAIAKEMALKIKEVCGIHAEAFSSAEFLHGPVTLAAGKITLLAVNVEDEALSSHLAAVEDFSSRGARVISLVQSTASAHKRINPLLVLLRFYLDIEQIASADGRNPDQPIGLKKVTETL
ncbi:glucosamine-6-phosphate deaminase NagB-II [Pleionea litopenaei]|uniref:SIS domain-containing protein n=1 Tax=Pleionea litopenaei TaxID=3070815 RepID=A0AA51RSB7_9GAMM|nr:SIS domain-containing protein [Pleionea sp. HL-JVS1]WMS86657.1 SIS domain-containing protein [Pleionea sp. HL-JVS1]